MAKVKGPLFSLQASGSLANTITYKKGPGGTVVRDKVSPKITFTEKQELTKVWFSRGVWTWQGVTSTYNYWYSTYGQGLTESNRAVWRSWTGRRSMSGKDLFMSQFIENSLAAMPQDQHPGKYGFCVADEWLADNLICDGYYHSWGD